jgi:hypothetical protein
VNVNSDKQWYVAIDNIRFGFYASGGASLLITIPPASQHGCHGKETE